MSEPAGKLVFVNTLDDLAEFLRWLGERRSVLAFDTETEGLNYWRHDVRLIQIGDTQTGFAFPWHLWGGAAVEALRMYDGPIVGHNVQFDVTMIEEHGGGKVPWSKLHDTMAMTHIVDAGESAALKQACERHMGSYASQLQRALDVNMTNNKWDWDTVPLNFPIYWGYAIMDTVLTARLYETLLPKFNEQLKHVYEVEMEVQRICMNMQRRGARVDLQYAAQQRDRLSAYVQQCQDWAKAKYGESFSLGSNAQVTRQLVADGVELWKRTEKGAWSLDEEVLEELENQNNELARTVHAYRKAQKVAVTYFENFLTMHRDSLLHPSIRTSGARTGRMSVTQPALQTIPRGPLVRDAFIPRPDHRLLTADYDQIEMRVLAQFCRDPGLIDAILSGDLHTETARRVYRDPSLTKKDPRRQLAKNAGFAKVYGAGPEKFSRTAGVTLEEGIAFLAAYDEMFPGVKGFAQAVEAVAAQNGKGAHTHIVAPSGRIHKTWRNKAYVLVNYLVQGTAAEVLKNQLIEMDNAGLGEFMILPVHDEVVFDVPVELVDEVQQTIDKTMSVREGWVVPITAGVEGPFERWGDKYRA